MTTDRDWTDNRYSDDAPVWLSAEEAGAWASGYNAAVRAASDDYRALQQALAIEREAHAAAQQTIDRLRDE